MKTERVFVGAHIPSGTRANMLQTLQGALPQDLGRLRLISPLQWHLTLVSPRKLDPEQVANWPKRLGVITPAFKPFYLPLTRLVAAPPNQAPSMLWFMGPQNRNFSELAKMLAQALGNKFQERSLLPHITVARAQGLTATLQSINVSGTWQIPLDTLTVFASQLNQVGALHTPLIQMPLGKSWGNQPRSHTADVAIKSFGTSLETLFIAALQGLAQLLSDKASEQNIHGKRVTEVINLTATDRAALLVDFLSEVLTRSVIKRAVFSCVQFVELTGTKLQAQITGVGKKFDNDVKAVTYHAAKISQKKGALSVTITYDV
ncbi:MAG: archease [Parcubacteria group bacterium]